MERALDQELVPDEGQALAQCGPGPYFFPLSLEEEVEQLISKFLGALTFYFQNTGCSQGTLLLLLIFQRPLLLGGAEPECSWDGRRKKPRV